MTSSKRKPGILLCLASGFILLMSYIMVPPDTANAASASEINAEVNVALQNLYNGTPGAKALADQSVGILVFPNIVKAGFIIGGQYGDGALRKMGRL